MSAENRQPRRLRDLAGRFLSVFVVSIVACGALAVWGLADADSLADSAKEMTSFGLRYFDWLFLSSCTLFLALTLLLALSRFGDLKLGGPDEKPQFGLVSWLAMLFAAGMGAGLLFWGAAEPMIHYMEPPPAVQSGPPAARWAMVISALHWGLHAWGIYAMGSLVIAYFAFRKGTSLLPSAPIRYVFGNGEGFQGRMGRLLGHSADVIAVLAVVFGVAGSLGAGIVQVGTGLHTVAGTPEKSVWIWAIILIVLTISYMISAGTSLDKGIKILSNVNMGTAVALMVFILFFGPTVFILRTFLNSIGDYLGNIIPLSTRLFHYSGETGWSRTWTLTYFIWWVSWTPFVGIFIARISRGRTIREFVLGVVFVPTLFSLIWFATFGGTGLHIELFGGGGFGSLVLEDVSTALFGLFDYFPFSALLSIVALFLIFIFLVTSADSASFVLGMMTSRGSTDPPTWLKLLWGVVVAALTAATLFAGGKIHVMRAIAISGAIPFVLIMLVQVACLFHGLLHERAPNEAAASEPEPKAEPVAEVGKMEAST
jgi:glycine betaine transporter